MADEERPPAGFNQATVHIRRETFVVLQRIREDESYPSYDHVIREALRGRYQRYAYDL